MGQYSASRRVYEEQRVCGMIQKALLYSLPLHFHTVPMRESFLAHGIGRVDTLQPSFPLAKTGPTLSQTRLLSFHRAVNNTTAHQQPVENSSCYCVSLSNLCLFFALDAWLLLPPSCAAGVTLCIGRRTRTTPNHTLSAEQGGSGTRDTLLDPFAKHHRDLSSWRLLQCRTFWHPLVNGWGRVEVGVAGRCGCGWGSG